MSWRICFVPLPQQAFTSEEVLKAAMEDAGWGYEAEAEKTEEGEREHPNVRMLAFKRPWVDPHTRMDA